MIAVESLLRGLLTTPRAWTFKESASLLGLGYSTLKRKVQLGEIAGRVDIWYIRPPGSPHAYSKHRGYISSRELWRWMKAQEAKTAAARQGGRKGTPRSRSGRRQTSTAVPEHTEDRSPSPSISLGCD